MMITFWKDKSWNMVHISEVISWKKCWVFCIISWEPLIAKKWKINMHHFAYPANFNLIHYAETLIHIFAKEYFLKKKTISLPYFLYQDNSLKSKIHHPIIQKMVEDLWKIPYIKELEKIDTTHTFELKNIETEKRIEIWESHIIVDIYWEVHTEGMIIPLIIEIYVTHACDEVKIEKLKNSRYFVIEINCNIYDNKIISEKDWITKFLDDLLWVRPWNFLYIPHEINKFIKKYDWEIWKIQKKIQEIRLLDIKEKIQEKEKNIINIPGLIWFSSPIPKICPIRQKIYHNTFKKNKGIMEKSPGISKILSNELFWDFTIIWNTLENAYIIIDGYVKKFSDMWVDKWNKFLIFRKMNQDFIRMQNNWKYGYNFSRTWKATFSIKNCKWCKYYRGCINNDGEIIDQCRYNVEN